MYDIIVAGDLLADETQHVTVTGPTPENANVLSVTEGKLECSAGGAGNVALNCAALGRSTVLLGTVGTDSASDAVRNALYRGRVHPDLLHQRGHLIRARRRIVSPDGMLLRLNRNTTVTDSHLGTVVRLLDNALQVLVLSDYGGGYLANKDSVRTVLNRAAEVQAPVLVDPPRDGDWARYGSGRTIFKPNIRQAMAFMRRAALAFDEPAFAPPWDPNDPSLVLGYPEAASLANALAASLKAEGVLFQVLWITLGAGGSVVYSERDIVHHFPLRQPVEVRDVTGAGDTALAVLAAVMSNDEPIRCGVVLANVAGGIAVRKRGCWVANWDEIIAEVTKLYPRGDAEGEQILATAKVCAGLEKRA